jgi:5-methylcytosine-specific restriction endonuclease McrA
MPTKRHVTAGTKKLVAGRQRYTCAANVEGYVCPLANKPFDEAGYEIDHIVALKDGGTNETSNLQALCLMCHRVKSNRSSVGKPKEDAPPKPSGFVYTGPTLSDTESDDEFEFKEVLVNGKRMRVYAGRR